MDPNTTRCSVEFDFRISASHPKDSIPVLLVERTAMPIILLFLLSGASAIGVTPVGARIQAGPSGVKAREAAGSAKVLGVNNAYTYGTVLTAPVDAKITGSVDQTVYHWYNVDWDSPATDGWSADVGFTQPTPNPPAPTSPGYEGGPGQVLSSSTVLFQWSSPSAADAKVTTGYQLNVRDLDVLPPNDLANYQTAMSTSKLLTLIHGHHYRFNAFAFNQNLYNSAPQTLYFWIAPQPTIRAPGYTTPPGPVLNTLTPTMSWNPVDGAQGYRIYVARYPYDAANTLYSAKIDSTATSFPVPANVLPGNTECAWKLSALFNDALQSDVEGDPSASLYFKTPETYRLDIVSPHGTVTVDVESPGPNKKDYARGTKLVLTPHPEPGFAFASWAGDLFGVGQPFKLTVDGNRSVIANFIAQAGSVAMSTPAVILQPDSHSSTATISILTKADWQYSVLVSRNSGTNWSYLTVIRGNGDTMKVLDSAATTYRRTTMYAWQAQPWAEISPFLMFPITNDYAPAINPYRARVTSLFDNDQVYDTSLANTNNRGFLLFTGELLTFGEGKCMRYTPQGRTLPCDDYVFEKSDLIGYKRSSEGENIPMTITYFDSDPTTPDDRGTAWYDGHTGYDFAYGTSAHVIAAADGEIDAESDFSHSCEPDHYNQIVILHKGGGYKTYYLHLDHWEREFRVGERISAGEFIGYPGDCGAKGHVHLHFTVKRQGTDKVWRRVDPYGLMAQDRTFVCPILWIDKP